MPLGAMLRKDGNGPRHQSVVRVARQAGVRCSIATSIGAQNRRRCGGDVCCIVLAPAPRQKYGAFKNANTPARAPEGVGYLQAPMLIQPRKEDNRDYLEWPKIPP